MFIEIASALVAFLVGLQVPKISDYVLRHKWMHYEDWWVGSYESYTTWIEDHDGAMPSSKAPGEEGALGLWLKDNIRLARLGKLTKEQVVALRASGLSI